MRNGKLQAELSPSGLTAFIIKDLAVIPHFQNKFRQMTPSTTPFQEENTSHGKVTGMTFSWGKGLKSAYIWLSATETELTSARCHYKIKDKWQVAEDNAYPFEFSFPLGDTEAVEYKIEFINTGKTPVETKTWTLN